MKYIHLAVFLTFLSLCNYGQFIYRADNLAGNLSYTPLLGFPDSSLYTGQTGIYGIETDPNAQKIFWSSAVNDAIYSVDYHSTNVTAILDASDGINAPRGLALDAGNQKIYWVESIRGVLASADYDGSNVDILFSDLNFPSDVDIDAINGKIYWSENGTGAKKICVANIDGTGRTDVITGIVQAAGLAVDLLNGKIYWTDFGADIICSADLDGSNKDTLVTSAGNSPRGVSLDFENSRVYWSDTKTDSISSSDFTGLNKINLTASAGNPMMIKVTDSNDPFPVELSAFNYTVSENNVYLNWKTETEVNNYGFEIQRRQPCLPVGRETGDRRPDENFEWEKVGFVEGAGNSNTAISYTFTDKQLSSGKISYRLKQIDNNGSYNYSEIIEVIIISPMEFSLEQNYPNPFNPTTIINYSIPAGVNTGHSGQAMHATFVQLKIYNLLGQEVTTLVNEQQTAGNYEVEFNGSNLASGVYLYKLEAGDFSSIKKLLLLK